MDLDDLGGEIVLLNWAKWSQRPEVMSSAFANAVRCQDFQQHTVLEFEGEQMVVTVKQEVVNTNWMKRAIFLEENEAVTPLPPVTADPVGTDLAAIPKVRPKRRRLRRLRDAASSVVVDGTAKA